MRVHVLEPIHEAPLARLRERATVVAWDDPAVSDLSLADAVVVRAAKVTREMLEKAPNLKVVGKHGVGLDAIDVAAAKELGKTVVYTPNANLEGVAELAVGFMLACARHIAFGHRRLQNGAYATICPKELTGTELAGKTLGLVGFGRINRRVAEILQQGFGMTAVGFDPFIDEETFHGCGVEKTASVENVLPRADYVSISVPLTQETAGMINAERLALCKATAIMVNTARGGIVDETALCDALRNGGLRAAASDVFALEPLPKDHPLLRLPNFTAMPHIGASTEESLVRMGETVVSDVLAVLDGAPPAYPV